MKNALITLVLLSCLPSILAQSKVLESLTMESKVLKSSIQFSVYLPDGYDTSTRQYPVVYLLNGYTGDERDWIQFGNMKHILDAEIEKSNVTEMIVIMPDGDDRLYMNTTDGSYAYEDMFINEFIPYIENKYRIRKEKQFRGISGLSMGGSGTLKLALKHHELFGACAAFSSAVFDDNEVIGMDQVSFDNYFGRTLTKVKGLSGVSRLNEDYKAYDIVNLVENKDIELLKSVKIYFDCGDDDFLSIGNAQLHIALKQKNIPHEYRARDGAHTWDYWRSSLPIGLAFISKAMTR
tara:strand:+ start:9016 stop:9894 length:879 start_codon:yes stop_codon:yes gene_type:complete